MRIDDEVTIMWTHTLTSAIESTETSDSVCALHHGRDPVWRQISRRERVRSLSSSVRVSCTLWDNGQVVNRHRPKVVLGKEACCCEVNKRMRSEDSEQKLIQLSLAVFVQNAFQGLDVKGGISMLSLILASPNRHRAHVTK